LTEVERRREPEFFEEVLKEATQAVSLLRPMPADRVEALLERGCIYRDLARLHHREAKTEDAAVFAKRSARDLERMATLAAAIELPRQLALAWTNLGWLYYYLGREQELEAALQQAYQPFPQDYLFPNHGPLPPMAHEQRKSEATLPYWSTLGKAEMLKAYMSLDRVLAVSGAEEREAQLQVAVKHITLSLAYDELVAETYFDLTRAEEGLHKRILDDGLGIETLHRHAQQVAEEQDLRQPTRLQRFLTRMFGPADLWA
jgi:tetratricopeptide (TPR) repeat protein